MQFSRLYVDRGSSFGLTGVVDDGVSIQEQVRSTQLYGLLSQEREFEGPEGSALGCCAL